MNKQILDSSDLERIVGGAGGPVSNQTGPESTYTVQPGDTLWSIAKRRNEAIGVSTSNANVAREVGQITAAHNNPGLAGNPDLIKPGQKITWNRVPGT